MGMKVTKVGIPIYFGFLRIVIASDFNEAAKTLKIDGEGKDLNSFGAFVQISRGTHHESIFNVFFREDAYHDLIAHEVVHLVNGVYIECGMKLDPRNDEPQAYLTGWFTNEIYKALNNK